MTKYATRAGLRIAEQLAEFVESHALFGTGIAADALWRGLSDILARFVPHNRMLLAKRDDIQAKLDAWHRANPGPIIDMAGYQAFLREIGYLVPEPGPAQYSEVWKRTILSCLPNLYFRYLGVSKKWMSTICRP